MNGSKRLHFPGGGSRTVIPRMENRLWPSTEDLQDLPAGEPELAREGWHHSTRSRGATPVELNQKTAVDFIGRDLTAKQKHIARLLGEGMAAADIAYHVELSLEGVAQEIRGAMKKLKLYNRQALKAWAQLYPELVR